MSLGYSGNVQTHLSESWSVEFGRTIRGNWPRIHKEFLVRGLPARLLSQDSGLLAGGAYLSALETIKGFEFSAVLIIRCAAAVIGTKRHTLRSDGGRPGVYTLR